MKAKKPFDFLIFMTVIILLAFGTVMVFSASGPNAYNEWHDVYYYLKKQLVMVPLGLTAMFVTMNIDYRKLGKWAPVFLIMSLVMSILVAIPHIGIVVNGAQRWIGIKGTPAVIQPSEFSKLALILFFAYSLSKRKEQLKSFSKGLLPYLLLIGAFAFLTLIFQKHLSATIVIALVSCIILFSAGAKIKHFVILSIPALAGMAAAIAIQPYRIARVTSFINPFADIRGDGWQIVNSLYAIGSGGIFGRGLGKSLQKFLYIPEPQNDFILSVLAEELGFVGVLVVLILFTILIWRGIKVSINAPDTFGSLLSIGIISLIAVQVIINTAVVTSSMPVTGMPLPFFSYGGTSLLFLMSGIGILLNISRYANYERI
jgi:cell division protein FtsW